MKKEIEIIYCNICMEEIFGEPFYIHTNDTESYLCEECNDIYINTIVNKRKKYSNKNRGV